MKTIPRRIRKLLRDVPGTAPGSRERVRRARRRLPHYPGTTPEQVEAVLNGLCVLVVGCGALGRLVAIMLARLSVARLMIVDPQQYHPDNLETQAYGSGEIGAYKAETVANIAAEISSGTWVQYYNGPIQDLFVSPDLADLTRADVIISLGDNLKMTADVGGLSTRFGKKHLFAAVDGATMVSQVRTFRNESAASACSACGFNDEEWDLHERGTIFSCNGAPARGGPNNAEPPPTIAGPETCGMAATLTVTQLKRLVLGLGDDVGDTMLEFCGFTGKTVANPLHRSASCRLPHDRDVIRDAPRPLADCSLDDLLVEPGGAPAGDDALLTLDGWEWAAMGRCGCHRGELHELERFIPAKTSSAGTCVLCRKEIRAPFAQIYPGVSPRLLASVRHLPLRECGADEIDWVQRSHGDTTILFRNPQQTP
ncbi:MAG: ThiF family adenylyltransferase [Akkermansiaceae bacterium]|nr:ThiF family adenylyltransferase [Akkermansiaceae bacterium]NNM29693.1 ThiF family adenylyltransferase [Akkermansiaceae bacterium]